MQLIYFLLAIFYSFSSFNALIFIDPERDKIFLFSYFKENGDGLHLAYRIDGYNWQALKNDSIFLTPTAGKDKLMRDPCIIRGGDGRFHMVWTVSWNERGIGYAVSDDLINWSEQKYIPVMEHEPDARNSWAPEITYDDDSKEYMIYWATTITGLYPETQSQEENAYNHRIYYVTTKDFDSFSSTRLLYEPGFNVIDATIVKDGSDFIMFLKDETCEPAQKNIKMARSKNLTGPYSSASKPITSNYWAEGPTFLKLDDSWIVYFDKYRDHKMGAVKSTDLKNWTDISDKISFPAGMRHGSIFKVNKEEFERLK
ncbi:hypothetical protein BH23BAC1_BH23BAC1_51680 [soil metagenome]